MLFCNMIGGLMPESGYETPYVPNEINSVEITYAIFYDLMIKQYENLEDIDTAPEDNIDWDDNTLLHSKFDGNLNAGNFDFGSYKVNKLKLKRKRVDEYEWQTIYEKDLTSLSSFACSFDDFYACSGTWYDYAVVTVNTEEEIDVETNYITTRVYSDFDGIGIADAEQIYYTRANCKSEADPNFPSLTQNTLGERKPYVLHNGENNYYTGSAEGIFVEVDKINKVGKFEHIYQFNIEFNKFLTNGKPKVLKDMFGRRWLIEISDNPTSKTQNHEYDLVTTIPWTEVGDVDDDKTMKEMGLIKWDR